MFVIKNSKNEITKTSETMIDGVACEWVDDDNLPADVAAFINDYKTKRAEAYPALGEQLDALWHAMDAGAIPKAEPFYGQIKAVKDAYPKVGG